MRRLPPATLAFLALAAAASTGPAGEQPLENLPAAPTQTVPVELPPDIRNDMRAFLDTLGSQNAEAPVPEVPSAEEVEGPSLDTPTVQKEASPENAEAPVTQAPSPEEVEDPIPEAFVTQDEPPAAPAPAPQEAHAETAEAAEAPVAPAPAPQETHAETAEAAEPPVAPAPAPQETHAETAEAAEPPVAPAPAPQEDHAETAEAAEAPVASAPAPQETHAETAEAAEPPAAPAPAPQETHAENAEAAEVPVAPAPAPQETHAETAEAAEPPVAPAPAPQETHAETAKVPVAEDRGDEAAATEPMAAEQPPAMVPKTIADFAAAYPMKPAYANSPTVDVLVAPNGFTWQGLEVKKEDLVERIRIFGGNTPDAHLQIQTYKEVPFETMRDVMAAARDAGIAHVSVSIPSVSVPRVVP